MNQYVSLLKVAFCNLFLEQNCFMNTKCNLRLCMGLFLKGTHGTNRQNKDFCFLPNVLGPVQLLYLSYIFILGYLRVLFVREKK